MPITRMRHANLLEAVGQIYEAALDSNQWLSISSRIAHTLDSPSTALLLYHRSTGPAWLSRTQNISDDALSTYGAHFHNLDVWAIRAAGIEKSRVFTNEELIPDKEFAKTEFYQDWSRKVGAFRVVGTVMNIDTQTDCIVGIHRGEEAPAFAKDDSQAVKALLPHLRRAILIRQRLNDADLKYRSALDVLERVMLAAFVVGRDCEILHANSKGERLLRAGNALRSRSNRLYAINTACSNRLEFLIRNACDSISASAAGALKIDRVDRLPLTVLIAPVNPANERLALSSPAALVLVRDPEQVTTAGATMRELFGFTAMEARLAESLCSGHSLEDFSSGDGISINTAKTHLRALLLKTNTKRQAELVAFLLRGAAGFETFR